MQPKANEQMCNVFQNKICLARVLRFCYKQRLFPSKYWDMTLDIRPLALNWLEFYAWGRPWVLQSARICISGASVKNWQLQSQRLPVIQMTYKTCFDHLHVTDKTLFWNLTPPKILKEINHNVTLSMSVDGLAVWDSDYIGEVIVVANSISLLAPGKWSCKICNFETHVGDIYLKCYLWNCSVGNKNFWNTCPKQMSLICSIQNATPQGQFSTHPAQNALALVSGRALVSLTELPSDECNETSVSIS